jgi:hypothetical protein
MSDWAHPEWTDWQVTRTGYIWHAVSMQRVDKDWRKTKNYARERRSFCGVKPHGKLTAHPERQLRCGNCLAALSAKKATP